MAVRTPETSGYRDELEATVDVTVASLARQRQRRPSLVILGFLCVALAALAGALVFGSLTTTVSVLVADTDLQPGEGLTAGDLRVVEVSSLGGAATIRADEQGSVIGLVARGPVPAGTVLSRGLFVASGTAIPTGMSVVGADLDPGAVPGPDLVAGDRVDVLGVASGLAGLDQGDQTQAVVIASATVWAVERPASGIGGRIIVSLLVPVETQTTVAQAAADGRLRLTLVGAG